MSTSHSQDISIQRVTSLHNNNESFNKFLAKRLSCRLESQLQMVSFPSLSKKAATKRKGQVYLFKSSQNEIDSTKSNVNKYKQPRKDSSDQRDSDIINEAAVSFDWVVDKNNTKTWCDGEKFNKRVINLKLIRKRDSGVLECSDV